MCSNILINTATVKKRKSELEQNGNEDRKSWLQLFVPVPVKLGLVFVLERRTWINF